MKRGIAILSTVMLVAMTGIADAKDTQGAVQFRKQAIGAHRFIRQPGPPGSSQ